MTQAVPLRCSCGAVRGTISGVSAAEKTRAICYCDDCQVYAHYLDRAEDMLDANGGTDAVAITPAQVQIDQGAAQLRCVKLGPKGLHRWYASCCRSPIANTLSPKVPVAIVSRRFVELDDSELERAFGPVANRIMARFAHGTLPPDSHPKVPPGMLLRIGSRLVRGLFSGAAQPSPFFDASGQPRGPIEVLDKAQRSALHARVPSPTAG